MVKKKILSIECEIPGGFSKFVEFESDISLLDWDIILFRPDISSIISYGHDTYQGKPSLSESISFELRERTEHWRREILEAFHAGKTILVYLIEQQEVFVDTGKRTYSGTGRNRQTTILVEPYNNYQCLPLPLNLVNSKGTSITLTRHANFMANYWQEFNSFSSYKVIIDGKAGLPLFVTKSGSKTVGALIQSENSSGAILLLPHLDMDKEEFYEEDDNGDYVWTKTGKSFGQNLVKHILEIDKVLKKRGMLSPMPNWARAQKFDLPKEKKLNVQLIKIESELDKLQSKKEKIKQEMRDAGTLKRLLYEKGKPLEQAIIEAMKLLGFKAKSYRDNESEFDVIFESEEGRFLGEVEGKDNKPITIDKLRQLEMNILEDFDREDVEVMAKGVLFGNAYRLKELEERGEYFTAKCLSAAKRNEIALVRTPDLFKIVQYLSGNYDDDFAKQCRRAILNAKGEIVKFPDVPKKMDNTKATNLEEIENE